MKRGINAVEIRKNQDSLSESIKMSMFERIDVGNEKNMHV